MQDYELFAKDIAIPQGLYAQMLNKLSLESINGQDIANPFTIEVEVCVNHRWGGYCDHTDWKNGLGHSVGTVKIAVKKYNEK